MVNRNLVKVVSIKQKNAHSVSLDLQLGSERSTYDASIVDRNGIFGLELPDSLGLKLRSFPPTESRNLVASVKSEIAKSMIPA